MVVLLAVAKFISPSKNLSSLSVEEPLTKAERVKLRSILSNPKALDTVIDRALDGWKGRRTWKKRTKSS